MTTFVRPSSNRARRRLLGAGAASAATAATAAVALPFARNAHAQQTIQCTFIAGFPPGATFVGSFVNGYQQAVDAALAKTGKYRIRWNLAHSGQIAKPRGEFEALQGGLGDIAVVPTPYYFDRLPMFELPFVTPFTTEDPAFLSKTYDELEAKYPIYRDVWAKYNQKMLVTTPNADAYVMISKRPLKSLADLRGMKVAGVGPNLRWLQQVGATPVTASMADWYTGLNTGIYEAAMATPQSLGAFKLCQPAKYMLDPGLGANANVNLCVNLSSFWNRLPDEVKTAFESSAHVWDREQLKLLVDGSKASVESCQKDFGMTVTRLAPEDRLKWAMSMDNIALEWADRLEKLKMPGREILSFYMDKMRAGKQLVTRDWDKA